MFGISQGVWRIPFLLQKFNTQVLIRQASCIMEKCWPDNEIQFSAYSSSLVIDNNKKKDSQKNSSDTA
jgi:hypothetical protein